MPSSATTSPTAPTHDTISGLVAQRAATTPGAVAYQWDDLGGQPQTMTWLRYLQLAHTLAIELREQGVQPNDRILVLLPDSGEVHASYLAAELLGCVAVGLGWRSGPQELQNLLARTSPTAMITTAEQMTATTLNSIDAMALEPQSTQIPPRPVSPTELWALNSTSGTTGLPKCVMQNQQRWFYFHQLASEFGQLQPDEVWMSVVPAPFGFGLWTAHFTPTILGVPCHVQSRFDAQAAAATIEEHRVTALAAVSSQFVMILDAAGDHDLSSLRVMFTGGERISARRAREFEQRTGCTILNFYGSNETGVLSGTRVGDPLEKRLTTGGRCVPEMQVRLFDSTGQRIAGDRGEGRPAAKGPALSPGYYDDPEANAELFTEDGWMFMGDVVQIDDDNWLTVVGRTADFVIRGGKNISAAAVEEEVCSHPAVAQAAAVAVPDERLGEKVGVFVELVPKHRELELSNLVAHLESRGVTKNWWPEYLLVLDELPRAPGGKIAKGQLKERASEFLPA